MRERKRGRRKKKYKGSQNTDLAPEVAKIGLMYPEPTKILPRLPAFSNLLVISFFSAVPQPPGSLMVHLQTLLGRVMALVCAGIASSRTGHYTDNTGATQPHLAATGLGLASRLRQLPTCRRYLSFHDSQI